MLSLFVGDVCQTVADQAKTYDRSAVLLTEENFPTISPTTSGTFYTSLADLGSIAYLDHLCTIANQIFYCPPEQWSDGVDSKQKKHTETVLVFHSQIKTVHNLSLINQPRRWLGKKFLQSNRIYKNNFGQWVAA